MGTLVKPPEGFVLDVPAPPEGFVVDVRNPIEEDKRIKNVMDISYNLPQDKNWNISDPDDIEFSGTDIQQGFWSKLKESFGRGKQQALTDVAITEALYSNDPQNINRAILTKDSVLRNESLHPLEANWFTDLIYSNARTAGQMVQSVKAGGKGAAVVGGAGALIGAGVGVVVPTIGEEPATITGGAFAGLKIGAKLGLAEGAAIFSYRQGMGEMYYEQVKGGADPEVARTVSAIAAIPYALIEVGQLKELTPNVKKALAKKLQGSIAKIITGAAKKYGKTYGKEVLEEIGQKIVSIAAKDTADVLSENDIEIDKGFLKDRIQQVYEEAKGAAKGMALLPLPGVAVETAVQSMGKIDLKPQEETAEKKSEAKAKKAAEKAPPVEAEAAPEIPSIIKTEAEGHVEDKTSLEVVKQNVPAEQIESLDLKPDEWAAKWQKATNEFLAEHPELTPEQQRDVVHSAFTGVDETGFEGGGQLAKDLHDNYLMPASETYIKSKLVPEAKEPWQMTRREYAGEPISFGKPIKTDRGAVVDARKEVSVGDYVIGTHYVPEEQVSYYEAGKVTKVLKQAIDIESVDGKKIRLTSKIGKLTLEEGQRLEKGYGHKQLVQQALSEDKPVPRAVLEEYKSEKWAQEALEAKPEKIPARDILGGVAPITHINEALKAAKAIRPLHEAEIKAERKARSARAYGYVGKQLKKGKSARKAGWFSTGFLRGPMSTQRYESISQKMEDSQPGSVDEAFASVWNAGYRYYEALNLHDAFEKLIEGYPVSLREVELIRKHFGGEMAGIAEQRVEKAPLLKRIVTLWRAGLLTGIKTSMLNEISNLSHGITETIKDVPASLVDSVVSIFTKERTLTFTTKGTVKGLKEGFEKGWKYLKTGVDERHIGEKYDYERIKFGDSKVAKALQAYEETVFHLMGAEDQIFYYGAKSRSIYSQAVVQGLNAGKKGKALTEYIDKLVQNPTDSMLENATMDAEVAVFQNRTVLGDLARGIQKSSTLGEVIVPFSRTPSAVAMQIVHYTPVGLAAEVFSEVQDGKFNQRKFSQAFGRTTVGTGVIALGALLFAKGLVNLEYPRSERERKLWEREGRKPFSIRTGNKWRSVYVLGPIGNVLLIGGYFQKALNESGSPSEAIHTALAGGAKSFSEQTFVVGMNRAIEAVMDPERSAERFVSSLAGSAVPTIIADVARASDYTERRYKGPWQAIVNRVPGARRTLEARIDVFGQDLPRYGGNPLEVMIDATRPAKIRQDVVVDEIRRLWDKDIRVAPTQLGTRDGYKILTQKENTVLWRRAGDLVYRSLFDLIKEPFYKSLDDETKGKEIERQVKTAKDLARAEIAMIKIGQGKTLEELKEDGLATNDVERYMRIK